jgi:hypothetical protein
MPKSLMIPSDMARREAYDASCGRFQREIEMEYERGGAAAVRALRNAALAGGRTFEYGRGE